MDKKSDKEEKKIAQYRIKIDEIKFHSVYPQGGSNTINKYDILHTLHLVF